MEIQLKKSTVLKDIPSGSAIEYINGHLFICGDDSSFLYKTDVDGKVLQKIKIYDWEEEGRIPKPLKPDFEAMANDGDEILLFGSGSLAPRNVLVKVNLQTEAVSTFSLEEFYEELKYEAQLKSEDFNIEGAAIYKNNLLLMNRGDNSIFTLNLKEFYAFVENGEELSNIEIVKYHLPVLEGYMAGFSGACVVDDHLVFCASVEKTTDWINDGEILGSFIGLIHLCENSNEVLNCVRVMELEKFYLEKIEGVCVTGKKAGVIELKAICDNDNGASTLVEMEIRL
ncbi:MAG: hypothetical protein NT150_05010 [Bacteroidetes bacterium]|nr:hypothetical protein [Bacteroidota bacterium]